MTASSHAWIPRFRAAIAAAALLVCWVSASAALAAQSPDVCSMTCCVEEGHCCCTPHHAYVKGQGPDGRDSLAHATLSSSCPSGCTTAQSITRLSDANSSPTASYSVRMVKPAQGRSFHGVAMPAAGRDLVSDPRGPPDSSLP